MNKRAGKRYVIARLSLSKGDLCGVESIREFDTLEEAVETFRKRGDGTSGGWPDMTACEILEVIDGEYAWRDEYGFYSVKNVPSDRWPPDPKP